MSALWSPYLWGLGASILLLAGVVILVWHHRHRPGGTELLAMLLVLLAWASVYAVGLLTHDEAMRLWLQRVMFTAIAVVPVAWLAFTFVYTGRHHRFNRRVLGLLLVISLAIAGLAITNPAHNLLWAHREVAVVEGIVVVQDIDGVLYPLVQAYIYLTVIGGSAVIIRESIGSKGLYHDQTAILLIGTMTPVLAGLIGSFVYTPIEGLSLAPFAFSVSGIAFGYAVLRADLLDLLPATRTLGRDLAIDHLAEGVLIVDAGGRVVDANRAATDAFDIAPVGILGTNVRELLAAGPETTLMDLPDEVRLDGRIYGVTVSPIHDSAGTPIGHTVVVRDITDRRLRKTQLEVLNRVLRHNLRNKLAIIQGHLDLLDEARALDGDESFDIVATAVEELIELSERSREFERLKSLQRFEAEAVDVNELVIERTDEIVAADPLAIVDLSVPPDLIVETHREVLAIAIENLVHNAIAHNDRETPRVTVEAEGDDDGVVLTVTDNGPGIPEDELSVLTSGRETSIQHGSGLGLWVTKWAVQYLRGEIDFELVDPRGTRATVTVPSLADGVEPPPVESMPADADVPTDLDEHEVHTRPDSNGRAIR